MQTSRTFIGFLKVALPIGVLAGASFAAFTMVMNRPRVITQPPAIAPPGVHVHEVAFEDVQLTVLSQGSVRPRTESQLVPEISGRVTWVAPSFAEGGFFEAGDLMVKLDPFNYQQALVSSRSQLAQARLRLAQEEAEADVARREWAELGRGDPRELTLRKPQLEDARAAVAAAEANVGRAERDLERAEITAPYAGRIRRKNVDLGQFVTVGNPVATIYAVDAAEVRLPLPDEELAYLHLPLSYLGTQERPGPRVTLRAAFAGQTHTWQGRIVRTESELDPATRMVHVVAEVQDPYAVGANPDRPPLAVGMYVEAEIEGRRYTNVARLPRQALQGRDQMLVVDPNDRLRSRTVDILRASTESVFVRSGLEPGELVAISTIDGSTEGMVVQIATDDPGLLVRRQGSMPAPDVAAEPEVTEGSTFEPDTPRDTEPRWLAELIGGNTPSASVIETVPDARPIPSSAPAPAPARRVAVPAPLPAPVIETVPNARPISNSDPAPAPAPPSAFSRNAIVVLPFSNISQRPGDVEVGATIQNAVSAHLSGDDTLTMVFSEAEARWLVGGGIQRVGEAVRVTARVVAAREGGVSRTLKVDGQMDDLSRVGDEVAAAVRESISEILEFADPQAIAKRPEHTVAVLPFATLGTKPMDLELSAALADAVSSHFTRIDKLRVMSSDAAVRWVVEGGIQRVGSQIRVTARIVETDSGTVIRAIKVDGMADDLTRLSEEVVSQLSNNLRDILDGTVEDEAA